MGVVAGLGTFLFSSASVAAAVAVGVAVDVGIDLLEDALIPDIPQASPDTMSGRNVTAKNSTAFRDIVYGQIRKGGTIVYQEAVGTNNEILHEVIVLAHGVNQEIDEIYFGEDKVWYHTAGGGVYLQTEGLTVQWKLGDHTSYAPLAGSSAWTSSHKLSGMTYIALSYNFDPEIYPNGVPKVTVVLKGRKVYDPRESSHSSSNSATWEYSDNPVLCLYDYLTDTQYGAGLSRSLFDETEIESAADYCDEDYSSSSGTQCRYVCHGIVKTSLSIRENIKNLLSCMHGKLLFVNGKFKILPLRPITTHPTTLTEDMIVGNFTMSHTIPRQSQYNVVKGEIVNAASNYIKTEYPQQKNTAYQQDDKEELIKSFNLPFTTGWNRAQQLANVELRKSRRQKQLSVTVNAHGFDYAVNDVIEISNDSLGITSQLFQITSMKINAGLEGITCDIEALEYDSNLHVLSTGTEVDFTQSTVTLPSASAIAPVTNIRFYWRHNFTSQGESVVGARVIWTPPVGVNVDHYIVGARDNSDSYDISEKYTTTNNYFDIPYLTEEGSQARFVVTAVNKYGRKYSANLLTVPVIPVSIAKATKNRYVVGNPNVAPTDEQWFNHFSRDPVAGDMLTVVSKSGSTITGSKTYVYVERDQIILHAGRAIDNQTQSKGSTHLSTFRVFCSIDEDATVTWSHSVLSYESNDGSTALHNLYVNAAPAWSGLTDGISVSSSLPASQYNNRTTTESVLFNKAVVRVTASWTSPSSGTSYNVHKDIDVVINVTDMQG